MDPITFQHLGLAWTGSVGTVLLAIIAMGASVYAAVTSLLTKQKLADASRSRDGQISTLTEAHKENAADIKALMLAAPPPAAPAPAPPPVIALAPETSAAPRAPPPPVPPAKVPPPPTFDEALRTLRDAHAADLNKSNMAGFSPGELWTPPRTFTPDSPANTPDEAAAGEKDAPEGVEGD